MANKEQLLKKVKYLQADKIKYILHRLGEDKDSSDTKDIELLDIDIESIREILSLLIDKDDDFSMKFQAIIEEDTQSRGITIDLNIITGIVILGSIANNLIKAKYPNKVIDKDINIDRGYSNLSDTLKSLAEVLKSVDD